MSNQVLTPQQRQYQEQQSHDKIERHRDWWRHKGEDGCQGAHCDSDPTHALDSPERAVGDLVDQQMRLPGDVEHQKAPCKKREKNMEAIDKCGNRDLRPV
jgi:hypothetical protein